MAYLEPLPPHCPPPAATDVAIQIAWRVVSSDQPNAQDFASHAAKGIPKRPIDTDCEHASCSLFSDKVLVTRLAGRLPKKRIPEPHICEVTIPEGFGKTLAGGPHIHLWMYAGSDPLQRIVAVEKCNGTP